MKSSPVDRESIESYIAREIDSKPQNQAIILLVLFVVNLSVFGFFGIFKGYRSFSEKRNVLVEYKTVETNLRSNLDVIEKFEPYIKGNRGLEFLDIAVPSSPSNSDFLQELARVCSRNGFILDRGNFSEPNELGNQLVIVNLSGRIEDLPDLLQDMEAMTRIISISKVSASPTKSTDSSEQRINVEFEISQVTL